MKSFVYKKFDYNKSFTYYTIYEIRYIFFVLTNFVLKYGVRP